MSVMKSVANPLGALQPLEAMAFGGKKPKDLLNPTNVLDSALKPPVLKKPSSVLSGDSPELKTEAEDREFAASEQARRKSYVYNM